MRSRNRRIVHMSNRGRPGNDEDEVRMTQDDLYNIRPNKSGSWQGEPIYILSGVDLVKGHIPKGRSYYVTANEMTTSTWGMRILSAESRSVIQLIRNTSKEAESTTTATVI